MDNFIPGHKEFLTYNASPEIFEKAKALRKTMTKAERILWNELKNGKTGKKFRRQHPVKNFIVDFYCHEHLLVIELDGGIHDREDVRERDEGRTQELERLGLKVIRFRNEAVIQDVEKVVEEICSYLK